MIFITVAMLSEGKPIIRHFGMKRISQETKYQIFRSENTCLIVTGVGGTKAMMATMYLLTRFHAQKTDFLLSIGIGALFSPIEKFDELRGGIYLARKIENAAFKRTFYPDLLYATPFSEADVITLPSVYRKKDGNGAITAPPGPDPVLADMEAAFIYETANVHLYAHHIFILKIVSDDGDIETVTKQTVFDLVNGHIGSILGFLSRVRDAGAQEDENAAPETDSDSQALLDNLKQTLRLTFYQQNEIQKLAESFLLRKKSIGPLLENIPTDSVKTKKEGKAHYEQLRRLLMEP